MNLALRGLGAGNRRPLTGELDFGTCRCPDVKWGQRLRPQHNRKCPGLVNPRGLIFKLATGRKHRQPDLRAVRLLKPGTQGWSIHMASGRKESITKGLNE